MREIIKDITENIEGAEAGGHKFAAGALIPIEKEKELIDSAGLVLEKKSMEEEIKDLT